MNVSNRRAWSNVPPRTAAGRRRRPTPVGRIPWLAAVVLGAAIAGCSIYTNLAFAIEDPANLRYFPPFKPGQNGASSNRHLGGEYYQMARSLVEGEGFSHPFDRPTGPTAWQPPVQPLLLASLLWMCDGDRDAVMVVVVFLQVQVLIGTGLLILALARQTTRRIGVGVVVGVYLGALLGEFWYCFQFTCDCWLVLPALDLLIAGLCWWRPLQGWWRAAGWGYFGGVCALINPIVGFAWGILSVLNAVRQRTWSRLALAGLVCGLTLTPWTLRNYLVFGRMIPIKSNLAYELYQTQCLQNDGLLQFSTFHFHPFGAGRRERQEYEALGEMAFLDRKRQQFWESVQADPVGFLDRVAQRALGATLWYVPFHRESAANRPVVLWISRLTHPLPFLALLVLVFTLLAEPLSRAQWVVIGVYLLYLLPYVGASYYDRYAVPLLGVKVLLVVWAVDRLLSGSNSYRRGEHDGQNAGIPCSGICEP